MKKPRLPAVEQIRGIAMMGVIGIHVGSEYLANPASNAQLTALFEIASRFSVPIFFFLSAFGLFYQMDIAQPFDYLGFLRRRLRAVLVPYLAWSVFYLAHDDFLYGVGFPFGALPSILFFGTAKYHIYFLVILIWFYVLMPLWIPLVRHMSWRWLLPLFLLQAGFDWASSSWVPLYRYIAGLPEGSLWCQLLEYRLNYWVMHYVFVFLLGGWLALHQERFFRFMAQRRAWIVAAFWGSLAALLGYYYALMHVDGYTQLEAVNTAHQLCFFGILYTVAASLFFFAVFQYPGRLLRKLAPIFAFLGRHSYFVYLAHPVAIAYLSLLLASSGRMMTAPVAILFYFSVLGLALLGAVLCRRAGEHVPLLSLLAIGTLPKKKKPVVSSRN